MTSLIVKHLILSNQLRCHYLTVKRTRNKYVENVKYHGGISETVNKMRFNSYVVSSHVIFDQVGQSAQIDNLIRHRLLLYSILDSVYYQYSG